MTALKRGLLNSSVYAGAAFAAAMTAAPYAWAQEPPPEEAGVVEEIVVTGSRIPRPNQTSPTAVSVVTTQQIEATGSINTGDIVRTLPAAGVSSITPTNSGFATAGNGITTVDLRNLGEDRTLTLVNGRRYVAGVVGTTAVDYSTIPTDLVDRIDVITGGASAVYGSDALAGVVNIVTRDDFEGVQLFGQYGISDREDDIRYKVSTLVGSQFADGRGHAVFNLGFDRVGEIVGRDRADQDMDIDATNAVFFTGDPADYKGQIEGTFSSFIPQGRFLVPTTGANLTGVFTDGAIFPYTAATFGFNRTANRFLQTPSNRISTWAEMDYDITDNMSFFTELAYVYTEAESEIEPTPLGSDQLYFDDTGTGSLPFCDDFDGDGDLECQFGIPLTSASVPELVRAQVRAANPGLADDELVVGFARRTVEVGNRGNDIQRSTFRVVFGLEGDPYESLHYEVSMNYGRTDDDQQSNGDVNTDRLRAALDTVDLDGDPTTTGDIVCSDPVAVAQGCVPINIFGLNSITPEGAAFIRAPTSREAFVEQWVINGFVTGEAYELPAGPLEWVAGAEYRQETSSDIPDGLTQAGTTSGNATPATVGEFDVYEIFGELRVPLLGDMAWVQALDLNLAARWSDYSTVGNTEAYAASLEYQATDWLKLRGQYARAVRAPNVAELFQPLSQDFPTVADPCAGVTIAPGGQAAFFNTRNNINDPSVVLGSGVNPATLGDPVAAACLADPTVAARVARDGGLALTQFEFQGVSGFDGGNPNLDAEDGDSWTAGLLFNPDFYDWLDPLSLSIDYFKIEIEDVISTIPDQALLDNCYGASGGFDPANAFCASVVRFSTGPSVGALQFVNQTTGNFGELKTSGVDVQASYNAEFNDYIDSSTDWGALLASLNYTWLDEFTQVPFVGGDPIDFKGEVGFPEHRWLLDLIYSRQELQVAWSVNYIGESVISNNEDNEFFGAEIGPRVFHDLQVRFDINDNSTVYAGVDNVFDEYVRVGGTSGDAGQATGWTTWPDVYDGIGRRFYGGLKLQF